MVCFFSPNISQSIEADSQFPIARLSHDVDFRDIRSGIQARLTVQSYLVELHSVGLQRVGRSWETEQHLVARRRRQIKKDIVEIGFYSNSHFRGMYFLSEAGGLMQKGTCGALFVEIFAISNG